MKIIEKFELKSGETILKSDSTDKKYKDDLPTIIVYGKAIPDLKKLLITNTDKGNASEIITCKNGDLRFVVFAGFPKDKFRAEALKNKYISKFVNLGKIHLP